MERYSYSRIETFDKCALQYKFNYIDRVESKFEIIEAYMGSRVHEALEFLYQDYNYNKFPELNEVFKVYFDNWDKKYKYKEIIINKKNSNEQYYKNLGKRLIEYYYNAYFPFYNNDILVGIEKKVDYFLDAEQKYCFTGKIDRVHHRQDNTIEIHDYKTGKTKFTQNIADDNSQLAFYQAGIAKELNDDNLNYELYWHMLLHKEKYMSIRNKEQINNLIQKTIDKIIRIENTKEFIGSYTHLCNWCIYKFNCEVYKNENDMSVEIFNMSKYNNVSEEEKLVDEYIRAVDDYKRIKQTGLLIKKGILRKNTDVLKGKENTLHIIDDVKISIKHKKDLIQYLYNKGKFEFFDISEDSLRKLLQEDKQLQKYVNIEECKKIKVMANVDNIGIESSW